ncbi:MAG: DUF975 family protein [Lachnospiraceae bacterium]|nr:DUF975 family protein [Lachnospiraceae bacterium]
MGQSQYKSRAELKYLARAQMSGRFGLLIGAVLIPALISFFVTQLSSVVSVTSAAGYTVNYVIAFIIQIILSVMQVGASLIYLKSACSMPSQMNDLLHGYKNNLTDALKLGFLFTLIDSICLIPCDIMNMQLLNTTDLMLPEITESTTINEMMEFYNIYYSILMSYYSLAICCILAAFLIKLVFMPAYYLMLDFPDRSVMSILKTSAEVMRGNKLRYLTLQISFIPLLLLSMLTCGIALIWVLPYMHMTSANFYLDIMAVRNHNI